MSDHLHVVMFSGGITSWATARRVADEHGTDNLVLLFADTLAEDEDLYRFNTDAARNIGVPITRVCDGRTPQEVGRDRKHLGNTQVANCSHLLKQKVCRDWLDANADPASTTLYVGIDWSEMERLPGIVRNWAPWTVEAPLTRPPYADKKMLFAELRSHGIVEPRLYALGFAHNNCLHPDTRFITDAGVKTLRDACGTTVNVLGRGGGWRKASVESFGEQATYEITLRRYADEKTVIATADHLWPVRKATGRTDYLFRPTVELTEGRQIAGMYGHVRHNVTPSSIGIMAGFTFGDGTAPTVGIQNQPARAYLCGDKDAALLPYFAGCRTRREPDKVTVLDLPRSWKQAPALDESQSYLYGWLAGYFAADGSVSGGSAAISSARLDHVELVRDVAARLGIATGRIRAERRVGYGKQPSVLYSVSLLMSTLREDFFVISEHRVRFNAASSRPRPADWTVVSVVATGCVEEVMCAVVPDGNVFTLDDNLLTHNCGGACVKAGQAQWAHLLRVFPDRYASWEQHEQEMRAEHGDIAILRDRRDGVTKPLPLIVLRTRIESATPEAFDGLDWGGCGCFTEEGTAA